MSDLFKQFAVRPKAHPHVIPPQPPPANTMPPISQQCAMWMPSGMPSLIGDQTMHQPYYRFVGGQWNRASSTHQLQQTNALPSAGTQYAPIVPRPGPMMMNGMQPRNSDIRIPPRPSALPCDITVLPTVRPQAQTIFANSLPFQSLPYLVSSPGNAGYTPRQAGWQGVVSIAPDDTYSSLHSVVSGVPVIKVEPEQHVVHSNTPTVYIDVAETTAAVQTTPVQPAANDVRNAAQSNPLAPRQAGNHRKRKQRRSHSAVYDDSESDSENSDDNSDVDYVAHCKISRSTTARYSLRSRSESTSEVVVATSCSDTDNDNDKIDSSDCELSDPTWTVERNSDVADDDGDIDANHVDVEQDADDREDNSCEEVTRVPAETETVKEFVCTNGAILPEEKATTYQDIDDSLTFLMECDDGNGEANCVRVLAPSKEICKKLETSVKPNLSHDTKTFIANKNLPNNRTTRAVLLTNNCTTSSSDNDDVVIVDETLSTSKSNNNATCKAGMVPYHVSSSKVIPNDLVLANASLKASVNTRTSAHLQLLFFRLEENSTLIHRLVGWQDSERTCSTAESSKQTKAPARELVSFQCVFCPYANLSARRIAAHVRLRHDDLVFAMTKMTALVNGVVLYLFCRHCDFVAFDKVVMLLHFYAFHQLAHIVCDSSFRPNAKVSVGSVLNPNQKAELFPFFCCTSCPYMSSSRTHATNHVASEHATKFSNCFVHLVMIGRSKNAADSSYSQYASHRFVNRKDIYACVRCSYFSFYPFFALSHNLHWHRTLCLVYVCDVISSDCRKRFSCLDNILKHLQCTHKNASSCVQLKASVTVVNLVDKLPVECFCAPGQLTDDDVPSEVRKTRWASENLVKSSSVIEINDDDDDDDDVVFVDVVRTQSPAEITAARNESQRVVAAPRCDDALTRPSNNSTILPGNDTDNKVPENECADNTADARDVTDQGQYSTSTFTASNSETCTGAESTEISAASSEPGNQSVQGDDSSLTLTDIVVRLLQQNFVENLPETTNESVLGTESSQQRNDIPDADPVVQDDEASDVMDVVQQAEQFVDSNNALESTSNVDSHISETVTDSPSSGTDDILFTADNSTVVAEARSSNRAVDKAHFRSLASYRFGLSVDVSHSRAENDSVTVSVDSAIDPVALSLLNELP